MFRLLVIVLCFVSTAAFAQDDDAALLDDSSSGQSESLDEPAIAPAPTRTKKVARKKVRRTKKTSSRGPKRSIYYNVAAGYSMGGDIKFSKVEAESTNFTGYSTSATFKTDAAIELSGGFMNMGIRSWGYGANLAYQMERKIKTATLGSGPATTSISGASISTIIVAGYGIYRWVHMYLPFGLNYSLPSYNKSSGVDPTKVKGDIGAEVGIGYLPKTTGLFFEGFIKMIAIQAQTAGADTTLTYKTAYLMSPTLKVGYRF